MSLSHCHKLSEEQKILERMAEIRSLWQSTNLSHQDTETELTYKSEFNQLYEKLHDLGHDMSLVESILQ
jgi:hypothetical protein